MEATASDNSGLPVKITTSHAFPLRVYVGSPVEVTYTATDVAGNKKSCRKNYIVIGKSYSQFLSPSFFYKTNRRSYILFSVKGTCNAFHIAAIKSEGWSGTG